MFKTLIIVGCLVFANPAIAVSQKEMCDTIREHIRTLLSNQNNKNYILTNNTLLKVNIWMEQHRNWNCRVQGLQDLLDEFPSLTQVEK